MSSPHDPFPPSGGQPWGQQPQAPAWGAGTPWGTPANGGAAPYGSPAYGSPAYGSPSYGSPAYGSPAYGSPGLAQVPPRNGLGRAALVLGILAVLLSWTILLGLVLGAVALVLGFLGRGRARRGEASNPGTALAGIVTGAVGLLLSLAVVVILVGVFRSDSGQRFQDCVKGSARGAAAQSCEEQLRRDLTRS